MTGPFRDSSAPGTVRRLRRLRLGAVATLAAATVCASATPGLAASPLEGLWRTAEGDGLVEIRPCGAAMCGFLVDHSRLKSDPAAKDMMNADPAMRARPMMDMLLLAHFSGGPRAWSGGRIYNPENGKTYEGDLRLLDAARLKVTGCLVRPLCGSQVWRRAP